jgi:hypothetical protein
LLSAEHYLQTPDFEAIGENDKNHQGQGSTRTDKPAAGKMMHNTMFWVLCLASKLVLFNHAIAITSFQQND